ncbi:DUF6053 domain-containing protein [Lysobacter enzymogenes]|uniref:DUF6053 domain-containing protein n=1 Tax=Lysobacter enzymogenes TaxID=69 RepID=UPI003D18BF8A
MRSGVRSGAQFSGWRSRSAAGLRRSQIGRWAERGACALGFGGRASGPMPLFLSAASGAESIGPEGPPTTASS